LKTGGEKMDTEKDMACCAPGCCGGAATKTATAEASGGKAIPDEASGHDEAERVKTAVRAHYGALAEGTNQGAGPGCCDDGGACFAGDYSALPGHEPSADLGLGCGLPTEAADLRPGETVVDLGSGAGNDAFVARALVGESGRVIGVDMTEAMVAKAKRNNAKLAFANVDFRLGEIEDLPIRDGLADVVISNCVLNLVPDKARAFSEAYRVLKPGGRLAVSDIVLSGPLPESLRMDLEAYCGCIAGAWPREDYLDGLQAAGFAKVEVIREQEIPLPEAYGGKSGKAVSITLRAEKKR